MNNFVASIRLDAFSRPQFALIAVALIAAQALLWIGAALLFAGSVRLDVAEGAVEGPEWRLSYPKHPPFSLWPVGLASSLGPYRYLAVYAIGFGMACGALLGVYPRYRWLAAPSLSFAPSWGRAAGRAGFAAAPHRVLVAFGALAALLVVAYVGMREIAARLAARPPYADMDGPTRAALAQRYWADRESGPIPYTVTLDKQRGMQASGSIVFDMPYHVRVLRDDNPANAPRIELADLRKRGALAASPRSLAEGTRVERAEVQQIEEFQRPMRRGASSEPIFFAVLPPDS